MDALIYNQSGDVRKRVTGLCSTTVHGYVLLLFVNHFELHELSDDTQSDHFMYISVHQRITRIRRSVADRTGETEAMYIIAAVVDRARTHRTGLPRCCHVV